MRRDVVNDIDGLRRLSTIVGPVQRQPDTGDEQRS